MTRQKLTSAAGFIAWEPFFICIILLTFELPSLTSEIIPEATCESIQGRGLVARLIDAFDEIGQAVEHHPHLRELPQGGTVRSQGKGRPLHGWVYGKPQDIRPMR